MRKIAFTLSITIFLMYGFVHAQNMVEWQSMTNVTESPIGVLRGTSSMSPAGAYSYNKLIENGDGWIEYTTVQTNKARVFGFDTTTSVNWLSINYGFYLGADSTLKKTVKGTLTSLGSYTKNDQLRLERIGDTVYYSKNNVVLSKTKTLNRAFSGVTVSMVDTGAMFEYVQSSFPAMKYDTVQIVKDAVLDEQYPTTNNGTNTSNIAYYYYSKVTYRYRSLIELDLSKIPARSIVGSAKFYTYFLNSTGGNASYMERVTSTWTESGVTWNTAPTTTTTGRVSIPSLSGSASFKALEIKDFVQGWLDNDYSNYGILFRLQTEATTTRKQNHASSDYATTSYRPYFEVYYLPQMKYSVLNKTLDGSYASTSGKKLYFKYTEEYKTKFNKRLQYNVYDSTNTVKAGVNSTGTQVVTNSPVLGLHYGDNFYELNLANVSLVDKSYYILEVINVKNEKYYLRFRYYSN